MSSTSESDDSNIDPSISRRSGSTCSSVQEEYKELVKFAVVAPKWPNLLELPNFGEISLNNPLHNDVATKQTSTSKLETQNRRNKSLRSPEIDSEENSFYVSSCLQTATEPATEEAHDLAKKKIYMSGERGSDRKNKNCLVRDEENLQEEDLEEDLEDEDLVDEENVRVLHSNYHQSLRPPCISNSMIISSMNQHYDHLEDNFKHFLSHSSAGRDKLILEKMEAIKNELINRFLELLEEKDEIYKRKEDELLMDLQNKKDMNKILENSLLRKDKIIQKLLDSMKRLKSKLELTKSLSDWKIEVVDHKRLNFCDKVAQTHYENKLASKAIQCWKQSFGTTIKQKIEKSCKDQAENTTRQFLEDYENRLESKEKDLDELRREILRLKNERDKMIQAMQEALMRGVCALNYEARNLFSDHIDTQEDYHQQHPEHYQQKPSQIQTSSKQTNCCRPNQTMRPLQAGHKPVTYPNNQSQSKRPKPTCLKCPNEKLRPCQDNFTDLRPINATGRFVEAARLLPVTQTTKLKCGKPVLVERHVGSQNTNGNTVVHIRNYPNSAISPIPVVQVPKQSYQKDCSFVIGRSISK